MKNYSKEKFCENLTKLDWFKVINCDTVNESWENFKKLFLDSINEIAPIKTVRLKQRTQPWYDGEILHNTQERDKAFALFKKTKSNDHYKTFCSLRNKTQNLIKKAKQSYFQNKIEEEKTNSKNYGQHLRI